MAKATPYLSPAPEGGLLWGELREGILLRRYKRFLADVRCGDGECVTAHTANTGAMLGCCEPGRRVWLSHHPHAGRKLPYSLEMIEMPTSLVGVNTGVPNRLVKAAAMTGGIAEFPFPATVCAEVTRGESRLDLMLTAEGRPDTLVEVKNCSLAENGIAYFPDAVTARGLKHVHELSRLAGEGFRAVLFILVQRADADHFSPADHIDPAWGKALRTALRSGVELFVYQAALSLKTVSIGKRLPIAL